MFPIVDSTLRRSCWYDCHLELLDRVRSTETAVIVVVVCAVHECDRNLLLVYVLHCTCCQNSRPSADSAFLEVWLRTRNPCWWRRTALVTYWSQWLTHRDWQSKVDIKRNTFMCVFTARAAMLARSRDGSRNSICPSVCVSVCLSHACFMTKPNNALRIFWYHTKEQSLCYSDTNSGR